MAFDMSLVQRGARLRRSPFYEAEQAYGPKGYTVYNHMLFPTNFDDFEAEYWHLLNHVTLWDVAVERNLEVQGKDGFRFAQLLTPRDLSKCAVGQGKYVLVTTPEGGIVNDPVMLRLGENHFWFALASSDALLYAMGLAASLDWDVRLSEPDVSPVQVQGPHSSDVVAALFGDDILSLKYYWFRELELDGIPLVVTRTGWTAEVGYEVYLRDGSRGTDLWERMRSRDAVCLVTRLDGDRVTGSDMFDAATIGEAGDQAAQLFGRGVSGTLVLPDSVITVLWPVPKLVIVGGGPVADALTRAAELLGWQTQVVSRASAATSAGV